MATHKREANYGAALQPKVEKLSLSIAQVVRRILKEEALSQLEKNMKTIFHRLDQKRDYKTI